MSELVERLIGCYVATEPPLHPLAELVEERLRSSLKIQSFLESLPEKPSTERLRVVSVTEHEARCACPFSTKDHENASYLHSEVLVRVDLATLHCSTLLA